MLKHHYLLFMACNDVPVLAMSSWVRLIGDCFPSEAMIAAHGDHC